MLAGESLVCFTEAAKKIFTPADIAPVSCLVSVLSEHQVRNILTATEACTMAVLHFAEWLDERDSARDNDPWLDSRDKDI